jgi:hypothetical protein
MTEPRNNPILQEAKKLDEDARLLHEQTAALLKEIDENGPTPALERRAQELRLRLREVDRLCGRLVVIEEAVACAFRLRTGRDPISGDVVTAEDETLGAQIARAMFTPQEGAAN